MNTYLQMGGKEQISDTSKQEFSYSEEKTYLAKSQVLIKALIQDIRFHTYVQELLDDNASNVREEFKRMKQNINNLKTLSLETENYSVINERKCEISEWVKHLEDDHRVFRQALLECQLSINARQKSELFKLHEDGSEAGNARERGKVSRSMMKKESNQLTDDLLSVTRMVRDSTEKSAKTVERLVDGSHTINSTKEELHMMGSVIGQAKKILTKYGRRENTDKLLILLGLIFFLGSCLVVFRNRYL